MRVQVKAFEHVSDCMRILNFVAILVKSIIIKLGWDDNISVVLNYQSFFVIFQFSDHFTKDFLLLFQFLDFHR